MKYLLIAGLIALGSLVAAPVMAQSYNRPVVRHPVRHPVHHPVHHRRPPPRHHYHHPVVHHPVHH